MTAFNVNGRLCAEGDAVVSVLDHGFLYGEGVYEVCRTYNGRPFLFDRHLRRMRASAGMIALELPPDDREMERRVDETLQAAGLAWSGGRGPEAYIRILVTRGVGDLSYDPASCPSPTVVVIAKPLPVTPAAVYEHGVRVVMVPVVRNHPSSINPLIKSNNLLNNALAMQHAIRGGGFEAVMRNHRGELAECSQSNLFVVRGGQALTPPLQAGLLAGITREFLFEVGRNLGVPVLEATLHDEDLLKADEAFLTSTTREMVPIVEVDDQRIGTGRPGPVTLGLLESFRRRADELTRGSEADQAPAFSA